MSFNKKKCLELMKESKKLRQEGKFLRDSKSEELTRYLILLDDQIFWESCKKYCQILDLFVSKKISLDEFVT